MAESSEGASKPAADLSTQIAGMTARLDKALAGDNIENAGALAQLAGALARLIDAQTKAEQSVTKGDLQRFVAGMTDSITAHVTAPEVVSLIQRDWRRLIAEVAR